MSEADRRKWDQRYAQGAYAVRDWPSDWLQTWLPEMSQGEPAGEPVGKQEEHLDFHHRYLAIRIATVCLTQRIWFRSSKPQNTRMIFQAIPFGRKETGTETVTSQRKISFSPSNSAAISLPLFLRIFTQHSTPCHVRAKTGPVARFEQASDE